MDLIGPYPIKGRDKTQVDFMYVTMIDPATSWIEIVELLVSQQKLDIPMSLKGQTGRDTYIQSKQPYFDKTSATVGNIIKGPGLAVTHIANTLSTTMEVSSNFTSSPL